GILVAAICVLATGPTLGQDPLRQIEPSAETGSSRATIAQDVALVHTGQIFALDETGAVVGAGQSSVQVEKALDNLAFALTEAQSDLDHVAKVNVYVAQTDVVDQVHKAFAKRFARSRPAVSFVQGKLSQPSALVAFDAVATTRADSGTAVKRISGAR